MTCFLTPGFFLKRNHFDPFSFEITEKPLPEKAALLNNNALIAPTCLSASTPA
jgi:hypothetical protein